MESWCLGTAMLDFDRTLACREKLDKNSVKNYQRRGWQITEWGGDIYALMFRPSARPFIEELYRESLDVGVLTFSNKPGRTTHFIEVGGMSDLIPSSNVWGHDCILPELCSPMVLVDDQPMHADTVLHKLCQLGLRHDLVRRRPHHVVTCKAFTGKNDIHPLTDLVSGVTQRIYTQMGWSLGAEIEALEGAMR